jgi:hypothetical protein
MIDNISLIKPLLNFTDEGDFYMLYVLKRKKDQPEGERDNHQSVRTIKTYCIDNLEYLDKRYEEIKTLCELFKARAYIHVQKQNHKNVSLDMIMSLAERIKNGQHIQKNLFDTVVGQIKTNEKRWIVDLDTQDENEVVRMTKVINVTRPEGDKIESIIPTKNGYHFITKRFDVQMFKNVYPDVDIQKKNPTLLYLPKSLDETLEDNKETWEEIEEEYCKDEYPVFGGPFTNALKPFEWLKLWYHSPKRKQNEK